MATEPIGSTITSNEVQKAWENWLDVHYGIDGDETMSRFFTYCHSLEQSFVDEPLDWDGDQDIFNVASSTAQHVQQLAGPHYKTVVAAYYAKHPWK